MQHATTYTPLNNAEAMSTTRATNLNTRPRSCSKGEELWHIHLQRSAAGGSKNGSEDDDHDYPKPRHPKRSIGEELFGIHLKRSKGFDGDYDIDDDTKAEKEVKSVDGKAQ